MIRQLRGTLAHIGEGEIVIDVQGVGYLVAVTTQPDNSALDQNITLHTYLAVRETALDLYGFATLDELEIFQLLLTLPKIGPKSALQILSQADIELLKQAVLNSDATYLSKMSGIGKKTAEKIVSELNEKFADRYDPSVTIGQTNGSEASDVIDALVTLGYPLSDARQAVQKLPPNLSTNDAVKEALRSLGSN